MRWEYEIHEAEREAQQRRVTRLLFLIAICCLVILAALPGGPGMVG